MRSMPLELGVIKKFQTRSCDAYGDITQLSMIAR